METIGASKDLGEGGERIIEALDLSDAELTDVLRAIAKFSGLNIVASEEIEGRVSVFLEGVSVRNALDAILTTNGYGYVRRENVVYVLPAEQLGEDRVRKVTRVYFLQYLDAAEVEESLKELFSSGGGSGGGAAGGGSNPLAANPASNSIIVTDTPEEVEKIIALLREIDRPFKQVRIEARLIEARLDFDSDIGVDWAYFEQGHTDNKIDVNLTQVDRITGVNNIAGMWQFGLVRDGGKVVNGFLQAEAEEDNIKILANPNVTALHNTKAIIRIVNEVPYIETTISQGVITESVIFKETGVTLEVTPMINDEGFIVMNIMPRQIIAGPRIILQNSNAFQVDERSVETTLRVRDGDTVVIGGLRSSEDTQTKQKVPGLGDIPILGNLFKRRVDKLIETDLLLFVTPRIAKDFKLNKRESKRYNEFDSTTDKLDEIEAEKEEKERKQEERRRRREERNRELRDLEEMETEPDYAPDDSSAAARIRINGSGDQLQQQDSEKKALDWEGQWSSS
jgi:type IV pilus assembly protein PilQ